MNLFTGNDAGKEVPMSTSTTTILHVRTTTRTSPGAILAGAEGPARAIAAVPGLIWKVWILDEAASELGGVYLFA
jgi:hypothetical protein